MRKQALFALCAMLLASSTLAAIKPFPASFRTQTISTNGAQIYVRVGGTGPAVVLLHGYGETGDMWEPLASQLAKDHTVVVPDLRGMGLSGRTPAGYDKKNQGHDMEGVLAALKIKQADLVTHDIGNMVGYALAAEYPGLIRSFVIIDAPLPGVGPWEEIKRSHALWHFSFWGPDAERLVAGRERIYLDRFWNEFSNDPKMFDEASREHYAQLYARPGAMHAGFEQFKAFDQDAIDNQAFLKKGMLTMPVLAVGGEKSFGPMMATVMRVVATNVAGAVVPHSGHWVMEENPTATIKLVADFLNAASVPRRLTPPEITGLAQGGAGAGTSGVAGIQTTILSGDPAAPGPYTIEIRVPAHTRIAAHRHRDDRSAVVVSGVWYFGYGEKADEAQLKALASGSFYTEPADLAHYAMTRDQPVIVIITGFGPTDTRYVETTDDPRRR